MHRDHQLFDDVIPFVEVARARSFRKAAERLGLTPAAVSKAVKRLEQRVGVQLLHRTTRRVRLSDEGELYLERCLEAMAQIKAGVEELALLQEVAQGSLVVSMSFILGRFVVSKLPAFSERYPSLRLHFRFADRLTRLVEDSVDVAVRIGDLEDSSLIAKRLTSTRWATVASPGYLAAWGTPQRLEELAEHRCLKFHGIRGVAREWEFCQGEGESFSWQTPTFFEVDQGEILVEAALAGMGICQAFGYMVEEAVARGKLVEILPQHRAPGPPIHALCVAGQQQNPRIRVFLDFLAEIFGDGRALATQSR